MLPFIPFSPQWWAAQAAATGGQSSVSTQGRGMSSTPGLVSRFVDDCAPRQRHGQQVSDIFNSLILKNQLTLTGANTYATHNHIHLNTTNPSIYQDSTAGYAPGHVWYNTVNNFYFFCYDATPGAAKWGSIPSYPYDSPVPSSPGATASGVIDKTGTAFDPPATLAYEATDPDGLDGWVSIAQTTAQNLTATFQWTDYLGTTSTDGGTSTGGTALLVNMGRPARAASANGGVIPGAIITTFRILAQTANLGSPAPYRIKGRKV